jgi:hypothetical protein
MSEWQPIETADKNNCILAWGILRGCHGYTRDEWKIFIARYSSWGWWPDAPTGPHYSGCDVTHWMPLPEPPAQET